ncbi:hypothetical protein E2I00_004132, partial [Balaenoptera physalus]
TGCLGSLGSTAIKLQPQNWKEQTLNVNTTCQKMGASPIRIPTVSNDTDWDFCFHLSQQTKIPEHQRTDELYPTSGSGESEEDAKAKEEKAIDRMSLPKEKLAQSQKKNTQANKELIRCLPPQAKKHAESAKNTLMTWKGNTTSDKEKKEILETLVMLYDTKSETNMKELKKSYKGGACGLQVSEKDLTIALGR